MLLIWMGFLFVNQRLRKAFCNNFKTRIDRSLSSLVHYEDHLGSSSFYACWCRSMASFIKSSRQMTHSSKAALFILCSSLFDQHRTLVPKIVVKFPSKNNRSSASTSLIRQTAVPPLPLPTQLRGALFDRQNRNAVCSLLTIMSRNVFRNYLIG